MNEELTYFQLRCPCPVFFPPLHGFPILSPMVQKLFRDYFCPRIGIWEESIIKPIRLQKFLFAKMALSQACWQSECMNQGEMKGIIPSRKCHCQDQSLAWSQSLPPLRLNKWPLLPQKPLQRSGPNPQCQPPWFSHWESESTAEPPSGSPLAGLGWPS